MRDFDAANDHWGSIAFGMSGARRWPASGLLSSPNLTRHGSCGSYPLVTRPASPRGFLFVRWGAFPKWPDADEATANAESIQ